MKVALYISIILVFTKVACQEVILNTGFTVRDFDIIDNTLLYIEKRDIKNYNLITKTHDTLIDTNGYFIGGYGLKLFCDYKNQNIITASNELIRDIGSIRFYDVPKKEINLYHVYYTTELMDFFLDPQDSLFFLSKKDKQIDMFKYGGVPRYHKIDSLKLNRYSRKINYSKGNLYYITDYGEVCNYNLKTRRNKRIYKGESLLVNFTSDNKYKNIYVTTFDGKLIKVNIDGDFPAQTIGIGKDIVEAIAMYKDKYILTGDWKGIIKLIDLQTLSPVKQWHNKQRIVKIVVNDDYFYTSSSDRTIKRWKIEQK
ncbi:WD40 repeat domain-containing protein [Aestuariivivens sediminis]|uniref:WD40 repeat domain-containing protein n=1 Tax=Aestuariivivens sediminis TaxID=2913557 RepID=UPI001F56FD5C|nr:hypothetical protein [Aestuariivivens sediminis]